MHHQGRRPFHSWAAALALLCTACGEGGMAAPRDPGTIRVAVRDEQAAPVAQANVRVEMPNDRGGVFELGVSTRPDGVATISGVPAGSRRVTVTPPAGYSPGADPLTRMVVVVKGQTVAVGFVLRRGTGLLQGRHPTAVQRSDGTGPPHAREDAPGRR